MINIQKKINLNSANFKISIIQGSSWWQMYGMIVFSGSKDNALNALFICPGDNSSFTTGSILRREKLIYNTPLNKFHIVLMAAIKNKMYETTTKLFMKNVSTVNSIPLLPD